MELLRGLCLEGYHSLGSLQNVAVKEKKKKLYFSSQLTTIMHFFHLLIYTITPKRYFTSGFLASTYASFAAEDGIHGSIIDVINKVLNCIIVSS